MLIFMLPMQTIANTYADNFADFGEIDQEKPLLYHSMHLHAQPNHLALP